MNNFFKEYGSRFFGDTNFTVEELYQAFKERFELENKEKANREWQPYTGS